jgi:hypothetical protein
LMMTKIKKKEFDMKRQLILAALVVSLILPASLSRAQSRAGTSAAPELQIPVGARYMGMGAQAAVAEGVAAITWNPAGVDWGTGSGGALFSYRSHIADIAISHVAVVGKFGFGSLGLSVRSFNIGTIDVTTEFSPDGTGEQITPTFLVAGLTYSKQVSDRVAIGANVHIVSESFGRVSASGVAFDAGVRYEGFTGVPGLSVGVVVKNIGSAMQYGGSGMWVRAEAAGTGRGTTFYKVEAASFPMPSLFEIGMGYKSAMGDENVLLVTGAYQNNNFGIDEYRGGLQFSFANNFFLRGGYNFSKDPTGVTSIWQNYTLGAGVNLASFTGINVSVDYAYVPVEFFSANHLFDVMVSF